MINSVSSVSFGDKIGAMDKLSSEKLQTPGMYTNPEVNMPQMQAPRKKGGFFRFLGKLILTAVILGAAVVGARKLITPLGKEAVDITKALDENATKMYKVKYQFAKFAEWIEKNTIAHLKKKSAPTTPGE